MHKLIGIIFILICNLVNGQPKVQLNDKFVLVIHGGAGTILKSSMTPAREAEFNRALKAALKIGYDILKAGGTALDAIEATVRFMEDSPLFNAGKGAVFTNDGRNELDAAIMNGKDLAAGSIAGVTIVKNPITLARAVMEKSNHVMMVSKGAEAFARSQRIEIVDPSYFHTERRWNEFREAKVADSIKMLKSNKPGAFYQAKNNDDKFGTVGAVALDRYGNLAAATSTGGMTNKKFGRVGDVPIIGAGTYANNATCAISCTGWGEYFIRLVMAKSISDMMEYKGSSLVEASNEMVMKRLPALGGDGGLVAVDKDGNIAMPFNSAGMYRGWVSNKEEAKVLIYKD